MPERVVTSVQKLGSVTADELEYLETCLRICRANRSNGETPSEQFMLNLLRSYGFEGRDRLTPADVEVDLEEYQWWFDTAIEITKRHMKRYPELLTEDQGKREKEESDEMQTTGA